MPFHNSYAYFSPRVLKGRLCLIGEAGPGKYVFVHPPFHLLLWVPAVWKADALPSGSVLPFLQQAHFRWGPGLSYALVLTFKAN